MDPTSESSPGEHALERIVDDREPRQIASDWLEAEMIDGRTFEELVAQLVAEGWDREEAAELAEQARRNTRAERGVPVRGELVAN